MHAVEVDLTDIRLFESLTSDPRALLAALLTGSGRPVPDSLAAAYSLRGFFKSREHVVSVTLKIGATTAFSNAEGLRTSAIDAYVKAKVANKNDLKLSAYKNVPLLLYVSKPQDWDRRVVVAEQGLPQIEERAVLARIGETLRGF